MSSTTATAVRAHPVLEVMKKISRALENDKIVGGTTVSLIAAYWLISKLKRKQQPDEKEKLLRQQSAVQIDRSSSSTVEIEGGSSGGSRALRSAEKKVDRRFVERFIYVLRTCMPSVFCRETLTATLLTTTLIMRTYASVMISKILGSFVRAFCNRDWPRVWWVIAAFGILTIPTAALNASLKFFTQSLSSHVREKITKKVHEMYLQNMNYYRSNKVGEEKLQHADQLITDDVAQFSSQLSSVYSNFLKPVVDFIIFSLQMRISLGNKGPLTMYFWFAYAAWISSIVMPAYWRLQIRSQELEGTFRSRHKRLVESSEMIAFNGGEIPEKRIIDLAFTEIARYSKYSNFRQLFSNVIMGYLNKYAATSVGMTLVCLPIFLSKKYVNHTPADIASFYIQCTRIMGGQAEAVLALFDLQKQIGQLAGLTLRVWNLVHKLQFPEELNLPQDPDNPPCFIEGDTLTFTNVSIYKPDGTLLVKLLNFSVPKGTRVMITGENGCGKSSLFRVLRGLWPLSVGTITSPPRHSLKTFYFLSQANFVPIGSLRDILIYPHTVADMHREGNTDDMLVDVLKWTQTELKVGEVVPDMDTVLDWQTVLSPGVKQRLAFARLLYHRPLYAILDECTNNIAPDVEVRLYNKCKELGITVFSISHKLELKNFHDFELSYDGKGGYQWIDLSNR